MEDLKGQKVGGRPQLYWRVVHVAVKRQEAMAD